MKLCLKDLTGAATMLAAALGLSLIGPHRAYAAPGGITAPGESEMDVKVLSPDPHTPLVGLKPVDISAFYQGTPGNQIVAVELYLDGKKVANRTLDVPETRGVVSFLVDASQLTPGAHKVVVRVTAADQEVKSVRSVFQFGEPNTDGPAVGAIPGITPAAPGVGSGLPPTLRLFDPSENGKVQGIVTIKVKATDPSGKDPYVSLFIDKKFEKLSNFAPYDFEWDMTAYPNGYHTIQVSGYSDSAPDRSESKSLRVYVNNPGGETSVRRDLLDGVKPAKTRTPRISSQRTSAQRKSVGRPLTLRAPDLLTADERKVTQSGPTRMASALPAHIQSTREIVRHLVRGATRPASAPSARRPIVHAVRQRGTRPRPLLRRRPPASLRNADGSCRRTPISPCTPPSPRMWTRTRRLWLT